MSLLRCENLVKTFQDGRSSHQILSGINWSLESGASVVLFGRSGSGKSTFLHCLAGLESASSGSVYWQERPLAEYQLPQLYRHDFGFVFQNHYLLPDFNVLENVAMAGALAGWSWTKAAHEAALVLRRLGLEKRVQFKVQALSGVERQRVSIEIAQLTKPSCVFADEPTAHLDQQTSTEFVQWLQALNQEQAVSFVIASHDPCFAKAFTQHYTLSDGQLFQEKYHE